MIKSIIVLAAASASAAGQPIWDRYPRLICTAVSTQYCNSLDFKKCSSGPMSRLLIIDFPRNSLGDRLVVANDQKVLFRLFKNYTQLGYESIIMTDRGSMVTIYHTDNDAGSDDLYLGLQQDGFLKTASATTLKCSPDK